MFDVLLRDVGAIDVAGQIADHLITPALRLADTITKLVDAPSLAEKAHGLALAAFSRRAMHSFESLVDRSDVSGMWVADRLPTLLRDVLAERWFALFLDAGSEESAWAALRVSLHLGDGASGVGSPSSATARPMKAVAQ